MTDYQKPRFSVIRYAGQRNEAITSDGIKVYRQEKLWVQDEEGRSGRFVAVTPDDDHFIFIDPNWLKVPGRWFAYCSCGGIAVIVGSNVYKTQGSPSTVGTRKGEMLICKQYADMGFHYPVNWSQR